MVNSYGVIVSVMLIIIIIIVVAGVNVNGVNFCFITLVILLVIVIIFVVVVIVCGGYMLIKYTCVVFRVFLSRFKLFRLRKIIQTGRNSIWKIRTQLRTGTRESVLLFTVKVTLIGMCKQVSHLVLSGCVSWNSVRMYIHLGVYMYATRTGMFILLLH